MRMVEAVAVQDVFASGLGRVDILAGGFARFILYSERSTDDGPVYVVAARIVMPVSAVPDAILQATKATAVGLVGVAEPAYN